MPPFKSSIDGFNESYIPEPNSGCWLWTEVLNTQGYPLLQCGGYKGYAHRWSFQHFKNNGNPLGRLCVCHHCDVPICVNPDHLFLGTHKDNMQDCLKKGRHVIQKDNVNYARGENNKNSKLTEEDVRSIWALQGKLTHKVLAEMFGVDKAIIGRIYAGRIWKHVRCW